MAISMFAFLFLILALYGDVVFSLAVPENENEFVHLPQPGSYRSHLLDIM